MNFNDLMDIEKLWPVDFFQITDRSDNMAAAEILYRGHPKIVQAIFWVDNGIGRLLKAMDLCLLNLWQHYKNLGYNFVDASTSSKFGIPNEGLLRFKETLELLSSLRYNLSWSSE